MEDLLAPEYVEEVEAAPDLGATPGIIRYFGDYEFLESVSRGGMGTVFKARQISLNRLVAVKLVIAGRSASATAKKRFQREAETAARLHHPHIIPIYEFGEYGGEYFLSMKLIENARSLVELGLPPRETVKQVIHMAEAVHYAHQHGVLHRDIKPSNMLCDQMGSCYLTDFGLAKLVDTDAGLTLTKEFLGTPAYMAPEQIRGGPGSTTTASDIYSLGATLYECLSGKPPFKGENVPELLRRIVEQEPLPPQAPGVDPDLQTICLKCLEKEPARRYASASSLAEELKLWRAGKPIQARPVTPLERLLKWARRKPALAALSLTALLALLSMTLGFAWFNFRLRNKNEQIINQVVRLNIESGARLEATGDPTRALLYFVEALRLAEASHNQSEVDMLRLRFDSLLHRIPLLGQIWIHQGGANDVQFSPDGKLVLSAGNDGAARVSEAQNGRLLFPPLAHDASVLKATFSPKGKYIATVTEKNIARLWRVRDGTPVTDSFTAKTPYWLWKFGPAAIGFDAEDRFFGHLSPEGASLLEIDDMHYRLLCPATDSPRFLAFRPGTNQVAIATPTSVEFCSTTDGARLFALPVQDSLRWLGFSGDGQRLIAVARYGKALVWADLDTAPTMTELKSSATSTLLEAGFLDQGRQAYTFNFISAMRLWDLHNASLSRSLVFPGAGGIRPFGNSEQFATFGLDGSIGFFDSQGVSIGAHLWHAGAIAACALDGAGTQLAAACQDGSVRLWQLPSFNLQPRQFDHWGQTSIAAVSPDGNLRLTAHGGNTLHLWQSDKVKELQTFQAAERLFQAAFSPSGDSVAAISWVPGENKMFFDLWGIDGVHRTRLPGTSSERKQYHSFRFGTGQIALGITDVDKRGGAEILDSTSGASLVSGFRHSASVRTLDLNPTGTRLLTGSDDGTARIWDARSGQPLSPLLQHGSPLSVVRFSPDGRRFVTAGSDATFLPRYAQIWSTETAQPLTQKLWHQDGILDAVFSPDGKILATGGEDNAVQLWNSNTGIPLTSRLQQPQKVDCLTFSPDGRLLLVSCRSSYLRVFHVATGEPVTDLIPHGASEAFPSFLPDNRGISFSGAYGMPVDLSIGYCDLPTSELRTLAEMLSNHRLTDQGLQRLELSEIQAAKNKTDSLRISKP